MKIWVAIIIVLNFHHLNCINCTYFIFASIYFLLTLLVYNFDCILFNDSSIVLHIIDQYYLSLNSYNLIIYIYWQHSAVKMDTYFPGSHFLISFPIDDLEMNDLINLQEMKLCQYIFRGR